MPDGRKTRRKSFYPTAIFFLFALVRNSVASPTPFSCNSTLFKAKAEIEDRADIKETYSEQNGARRCALHDLARNQRAHRNVRQM